MLKHEDAAADRRALCEAVLALKSPADAAAFFADLCTPAELDALAGRWKVARLLDRGLPYREIAEKTGISTATVTRVARCLTYGRDGGYRRVLDKLSGGTRGR
ncbi:MAG: helix-turn-helix domain-containing protein [Elusimicrobia bacterium]|nr:helix-turn-helix domain-containing protein [Elusimicrobiota bacterium]